MIDDRVFDAPQSEEQTGFRLASIVAVTTAGASVQFEGESESSDKIYSVVQSYNPTVGDRVVMAYISGSYIILGSVGAPKPVANYIPTSEKGTAIATLNSNGKVVQTALKAESAAEADVATNFTGRHTGSTLGFFNYSGAYRQNVSGLSGSASLTTAIDKINEIITALKRYSLF